MFVALSWACCPYSMDYCTKPIDAFRFVPLTRLLSVVYRLVWIGRDDEVHFLVAGILLYMLPVIVTRINEVEDVYLRRPTYTWSK